jgi:hypothetical protein
VAAAVNPVLRAPATTSLYGAARRGPTNHDLVGRHRSGRGIKAWLGHWTESMKINLTFSPLISTYDLNLKYLSLFSFHDRLAHRVCFITTVSIIRLTAIIHLYVLKQILN